MIDQPRHRGGYDANGAELRDASVVHLVGCHQEMVIKHLIGQCAVCLWFDITMKPNEFSFALEDLERVSW